MALGGVEGHATIIEQPHDLRKASLGQKGRLFVWPKKKLTVLCASGFRIVIVKQEQPARAHNIANLPEQYW